MSDDYGDNHTFNIEVDPWDSKSLPLIEQIPVPTQSPPFFC